MTDNTTTRKRVGAAQSSPLPPFGGCGESAQPPLVTVTKTASPSQAPDQYLTDTETGEMIGYSITPKGDFKLDKPSHQSRASAGL